MAALTSPGASETTRTRKPKQAVAAAVVPPVPTEQIVLTHRGGLRSGGTVWENTEYWNNRRAQKRTGRSRVRTDAGNRRPGTYPQAQLTGRGAVPQLQLGLAVRHASHEYKPPPLRRGAPDHAEAGAHTHTHMDVAGYGDSLQTVIDQSRDSRSQQPARYASHPQRRAQGQGGRGPRHGQSSRYQSTSPTMRKSRSLQVGASANLQKSNRDQSSYGRNGNRGTGAHRRGNTTNRGNTTSRVF